MAKLFNRAKMTTTTTGSGTITLGSASNGFQSFADAGVADGDVVQYVIEEGANFEIGTGTYSSSGTSLTRSPSESSNSNNAITLAGQATVSITAVADDLNRLQHNGTDKVTVSSTGASVTGNLAVSGTVDGVDVSARDAVLTSTTTTANAALPKAGGTVTGAVTFNGGIEFSPNGQNFDINRDASSRVVFTYNNQGTREWAANYNSNGDLDYSRASGSGQFKVSGDRVFTDGYHPNADKWTTSRTLSLTGGVTGSVSWDGSANATLTSTVALATASAVGGIKIGYVENGKNYPVELDGSGKAYVNVPWTDTNTDTNTTYTLKAQQTGGNNTNPNLWLDASSGTDDYVQLVGSGATTVTRNSDGQITISSTDTNTDTNQLTTFQLEDGDGTEVTISHGKEVKFVEGGGIDINWTDTSTGSDGDPYDLTFTADSNKYGLARLLGWEHTYGSSNYNDVYYDEAEDAVALFSSTDTSIGMAFRAVAVTAGQKVKFTINVKSSAADSDGLYLRLYYYTGDLPDGKTHVSNTSTGGSSFVQEDTNGDAGWYENGAHTTSWRTFERVWTAPTTGYVSLVLLNWSGFSGTLYAKQPDIETQSTATADKWTTARTLSLTGEASGSVSWDGSANASLSVTLSNTALDDQYVNVTGDTMTGNLTIRNANDYQLKLDGGSSTWSGISFEDVDSNDTIWYRGANSTFAIGGGGSNVAGKKLHVDGGMSVGSSSDATSTPTQGIYSEGGISIAGTIGTRDNTLSIVGDANSGPLAAKVSQYDTVFSVLPWSGGVTYLSSGVYYDDGAWVHASSNTDNALIAFSGDGVAWYSSSNSSGSWNVASDVDLWNSSGTWVSGVAKSPTLTLSGDASGSATFTNLGNATLSVSIANDSHSHAWQNITAGTRKNYNLRFQPNTSTDYAGFQFYNTSGAHSGYFLVAGSGVNNTSYQPDSISLVSDASWLSLVQRNSTSGIRFSTGTGGTPAVRMEINSNGIIEALADIDMNDNDIREVNRLNFNNHEGDDQTAATGDVIFDENFYSDTEYGSTSIWAGGNGGGLAVYNEDGWGRILTDRNMKWANGNFAGMTIGATSDAPHNAGGLQIAGSGGEKIVLSGNADPYIRFQENTTDRAYIQWVAGNDSLMIRNQQTGKVDIRGNNVAHLRLLDNDGNRRGSLYANTSNQVGLLDSDDNWAYMIERDVDHEWRINNSIKMTLNTTSLTLDCGTSSTLNVKCDDAGLAMIRANGDGQGTGAVEVGQSNDYGGGIYYNGDNSPAFASGEASDTIGFYRLSAGTRTEVFYYGHSSSDVYFNGATYHPTIYLNGSIVHNGDTNTYIEFHANDQWRVVCAGTEQLEVNTTRSQFAGHVKLTAGHYFERSDHHTGHLVGSYNSVGANSYKSNPIYTIGSSYNPTDAALSNMYGIGYSHVNASFLPFSGGWGMYVAADGDARVWLSGSSGHVYATGDVRTAASDARLKTNVQEIPDAVEKVKAIRGVTFDWVDDIESEYDYHPMDKHDIGVIAQEVEAVLPELVDEAPFNGSYTEKTGKDHGFRTVRYDRMVALLIEAVKEQQTQIDDLQQQVQELKNK